MAVPVPGGAHQQALRRVVEDTLARFPACSASAITLVKGHEPVLLVGTSLLGQQLEEAQWDLGHGPGIDAVRQLQVFNVACLRTTTSWPEFSRLATSRGMRSAMAVPITGRGSTVGALSLYSQERDGFAAQEQVGLRCAAEAALALMAPMQAPSPGNRAGSTRANDPDRAKAVS